MDEKFAFWHDRDGRPIGVDAILWENSYPNDVAVIILVPEMLEDLREDLESYQYVGIIEEGKVVVMVGDEDGYHYIKTFPDWNSAEMEGTGLIKRFENYVEMEDANYFDRHKYLALSRDGA